jgi:hypothetical protein
MEEERAPAQKRSREDEEAAESLADAKKALRTMTMWTALSNRPKKTKQEPSIDDYKPAVPRVLSIVDKKDPGEPTGFALFYGEECYLLPMDVLQSWNCYSMPDRDVFAPFPLVAVARGMSDDMDHATNQKRGQTDEQDYEEETMKVVRKVILDEKIFEGEKEGEKFCFFDVKGGVV